MVVSDVWFVRLAVGWRRLWAANSPLSSPGAGAARRPDARKKKQSNKKKDSKIFSKNFPFLESFSYQ